MTKLIAPLPEKGSIIGDAEPDIVPIMREGPNPPIVTDKEPNVGAGLKAIRKLLKRGLLPRAVVADVSALDHMDPFGWGIVVAIDPLNKNPIRVKWLDSKYTWTDGHDLIVMHRGISDAEALERNKFHETAVVH